MRDGNDVFWERFFGNVRWLVYEQFFDIILKRTRLERWKVVSGRWNSKVLTGVSYPTLKIIFGSPVREAFRRRQEGSFWINITSFLRGSHLSLETDLKELTYFNHAQNIWSFFLSVQLTIVPPPLKTTRSSKVLAIYIMVVSVASCQRLCQLLLIHN